MLTSQMIKEAALRAGADACGIAPVSRMKEIKEIVFLLRFNDARIITSEFPFQESSRLSLPISST